MADTDIIDINSPIENPIDFSKPVELREREEVFVFDKPKIREAINNGSDINDDDKQRLINLHIASKTNQDPNTMDYKAAVGSYIGEFAQDAPIAQTFERLQGKIKPEIDDNYTKLRDFQGLSEEDQLKQSVQIQRTAADSGIFGGGMGAVYVPSQAKQMSVEEEQALKIASMSPEEKRLSIMNYQQDLLGKSRRAIIEMGENDKVLSPEARRMADKMAFGHDVGLAAYNALSETDQTFIFQYTRAINPEVDSSSWAYLTERLGQTKEDIGESLVKTGQRMASAPDDPTRVYEKYITNMDKSAVDHFADTGEWPDEESKNQARALAIEVYEAANAPAIRELKNIERSLAATGQEMSLEDSIKQAESREGAIQKTLSKIQNKLYEGREHVNQRRFDKAVKGATRKLFKAGIAEEILVEGTVVMADMAVALGVGIPTLGTGTVSYSAGRVFGDFTETLIDDHNVDPDKATAIAGVGSIVYSAIEKLQVGQAVAPFIKKASPIQKKFVESFRDGLPAFAKKIADSKNPVMVGLLETAKTLTVETAEESAQAFTEQLMKAYAKEFAEAEGVEYSELAGDWMDQTVDALKGMALLSMGRGVMRGRKQFSGGFDNLTMKENIIAEPAGLEMDLSPVLDDLSQNIKDDLIEAETDEEIQAVLDRENLDITPEEFRDHAYLADELTTTQEVELEAIEKDLQDQEKLDDVDFIDRERDVAPRLRQATAQELVEPISEYAELIEQDGKNIIKSKNNDNSFELVLKPIANGIAGQYRNGVMTLPENVKDFTFSHELYHAAYDMGVVTPEEQATLVESAVRRIDTEAIDQRYQKYFKENQLDPLSDALRDEEFAAHLIERAAAGDINLEEFTPEERTIWQKVVEFVKSLYSSKFRAERKQKKMDEAGLKESIAQEQEANQIIQQVLTGEVLSRDVLPSIDEIYEAEYGSQSLQEESIPEEYYQQFETEPDSAAASRMQEDVEREEALLETALGVPSPVNEARVLLSGRKFKFDEKFEEEVRNLSPAEKRRLSQYRTDDKNASNSDVILDELIDANILDENATITEMIERLSMPVDTKFSLAPPTDTPEFSNWFGDSKVVNEDGSPKVVYHGTPSGDFSEFYEQQFFTTNKEYAEKYLTSSTSSGMGRKESKPKIFEVYIKSENPFDTRDPKHAKILKDQFSGKFGEGVLTEKDLPDWMEGRDIAEFLIDELADYGFDSVIVDEGTDNSGDRGEAYIVFEPTQIKSATENIGTFDPTNPDIRYSLQGSKNPERLAAISLAGHAFETGKPLNEDQARKVIRSYGIEDLDAENSILDKAQDILQEMEAEKGKLKNHKEITQALNKAALLTEFRSRVDELERSARRGGRLYEKTVQDIKARKLAQRKANVQEIDEDAIAYLVSQYHENITKEESSVDVSRLLPSLREAIRKEMVKNGLITKRNKKGYLSMPEYRATLADSLSKISINLVRQITPGRRKDALYRDSRRLKEFSTSKSIESNFNKLVGKIHESRITDDKDTLLKRFNKIFKAAAIKGREKTTQELIHSKVKKDEHGNIIAMSVHPMVKRELNLIKQVAKLSQAEAETMRDNLIAFINDPSDLEGTDSGAMFKALESQFPAFKKYNHLEPVDRATVLLNAVHKYGGIKEKTNVELSDAIDTINETIESSKKTIEDLINKKNEKAQPRRDAVADLKGKRRGELGQKFDRFLFSSFGMRSAFQDITRQAPADKAAEAEKHLNEILGDWNDSIHARDVAIMHTHQELGDTVKKIYDVKDDWKILKDMNTKKVEYSEFSKHGDKMSKFQVMQLYASAIQQDYLENAKKHNRKISEYAKVLTPQDMQFVQWFRDYYAKERTELSAQLEKMTGVPIEMIDPYYVPVKVESNQAGLGTEINATAIIPPGMIKRVNHNLDFDESVGMFEIWARKVEENEHFKNTADTAVEMRSVFSTKPVHDAIEHNYGKSYKNAFMTLIKDNINNGGPSTYDLKAIDTIRGAWTASKFALNARIGIKQVTSIPAFGLEIGLVDTGKYLSEAWTDEGRAAMKELWNSDLRKERWGAGNTEAINNAIGGMSSHTTLSKWVKRSMIFNNLGDMAPTLLIGQGIYRSYTDTYYSQGPQTEAALKEAKARALSKTFQIVESTQQSSKLKDMAEWQRRGGSLGKMAAQFTNTTRQFLERDFTDIRGFLADPRFLEEDAKTGKKKFTKKFKRSASTVFINHVLLPGAYNGMNMVINKLMGDDIDEDDWWLMFASMVSGPMSGFIVFGSMITGAIETGITGRAPWGNKSLTPFAGIKDDVNNVVLATEGILTTDWDQFDKAFTKLMKSLFAPYREVSKVIKNNE